MLKIIKLEIDKLLLLWINRTQLIIAQFVLKGAQKEMIKGV